MKRTGVLLAVAALMTPAARASAADTGWISVTKFHGARGQACMLESTPDYPFHILFRIDASRVESGWSKAILTYKRPTDTTWRGWIPTARVQPGEVHPWLPGSTDDKPKALRVAIKLEGGLHKSRRFAWDDLPMCPDGAEPFPTS